MNSTISCQIAFFLIGCRFHIHPFQKSSSNIYQIEFPAIARATCRYGIISDKKMAEFLSVSATSAISKMTKKQFSHESHMSFHHTGMIGNIFIIFYEFVYFGSYGFKDFGNCLFFGAADAVHVRIAGFHVQFLLPQYLLHPVRLCCFSIRRVKLV